ncbi:MAG: hypothetical protein P8P16_04155, partial [Amylibacter sp.]|nr:hypothetical protein [Amylibacter sp.]
FTIEAIFNIAEPRGWVTKKHSTNLGFLKQKLSKKEYSVNINVLKGRRTISQISGQRTFIM